ncbi:MAG: SGNH/GDSL hydrolase family protein [Planctomycetota bacterium]|jgi:lysophospholipase L1-like esterase
MKTVILIGDSIRMGYEATVRSELAELAEVWTSQDNGGTSENVLARLDEWAISRQADLVHLNCGLHDIKTECDQDARGVPLDAYRENVRRILSRLKTETDATIVWASCTPVNEAWHNATKPFARFEADVNAYNAAAAKIAEELGIVVDDLFSVAMSAGRDELLIEDGVHFKPEGSALLGEAVAECIKGLLA